VTKSCGVKRVVEMTLELVEDQATKNKITTSVSIPNDLRVHTTQSDLSQMCLSLVGNAVDAMKGGGLLTIEAEAVNDSIVIDVRDEDPGIERDIVSTSSTPSSPPSSKAMDKGSA
jgi:C4-dicarboxylate-specific signal transduction histidine kinase|tara:strand:- start:482 stop:826 length:345 start_codon:yes stop_codon:yes gene_type:complete